VLDPAGVCSWQLAEWVCCCSCCCLWWGWCSTCWRKPRPCSVLLLLGFASCQLTKRIPGILQQQWPWSAVCHGSPHQGTCERICDWLFT
jgi:hypothetical protein